jgi:predicted nuclease of predicted toxin-antitoxin system
VQLLLDQNLSFRLARRLEDLYPGSLHVSDVGLHAADDDEVWRYAAAESLLLVSKDSDFYQRSLLFGPPPKVVWLRLGNCTTGAVEECLRRRTADVQAFVDDPDAAFLVLS